MRSIAFSTLGLLLIMAMVAGIGCKKTQNCVDPSKVSTTYTNCGTLYDPVCGCDNVTYQNSCQAQSRGVVQWIQGPYP